MARRAIIIHSIEHARAALSVAARVGQPVTLYSAQGAAAYAGAGWFRSVAATARGDYPMADCEIVLDCGGHAGLALAALRGRCSAIVFAGTPAQRRKIAAIAAAQGARLDAGAPVDALDLNRSPDPRAAVAAWLAQPAEPRKNRT